MSFFPLLRASCASAALRVQRLPVPLQSQPGREAFCFHFVRFLFCNWLPISFETLLRKTWYDDRHPKKGLSKSFSIVHFKTNFALCFVASCCPGPKLDIYLYIIDKECNGLQPKIYTFRWSYVWSAATKLLGQASSPRSLGSDAGGRCEVMRCEVANELPTCIFPHPG